MTPIHTHHLYIHLPDLPSRTRAREESLTRPDIVSATNTRDIVDSADSVAPPSPSPSPPQPDDATAHPQSHNRLGAFTTHELYRLRLGLIKYTSLQVEIDQELADREDEATL